MKSTKIREDSGIDLSLKNLISIIVVSSLAVYSYFGIIETINKHSTTLELVQKDLELNSEFRIKYPRGELGQSSGEAELFLIVEHLSGLVEQLEEEVKGMRNNAVNIDFLKSRTEKLTEDVEKLIRNENGGH
tara:strand:- start:2207 stop:2602 length:396 start_codon:yes stop_codon:yes gene_type:complete